MRRRGVKEEIWRPLLNKSKTLGIFFKLQTEDQNGLYLLPPKKENKSKNPIKVYFLPSYD